MAALTRSANLVQSWIRTKGQRDGNKKLHDGLHLNNMKRRVCLFKNTVSTAAVLQRQMKDETKLKEHVKMQVNKLTKIKRN